MAALYQLGTALLDKGDLPAAERTFDRLIAVAPRAPEGYYGRARLLRARGQDASAALGQAEKLVESDARERLSEQGLRGEALDAAVREAADRLRRTASR